ncbi:MAG: 50S ribosomal protein L9 [Spirochaetota bacterium]
MKVILQDDIKNLGDAGDVNEVSDGYARNFLLPKKLVIPFTDSSKAAMDHQNHLIRVKKEKRKKSSAEIAEKMKELTLNIKAKVGDNEKLFGSITSMDISDALGTEGYTVDKRKIELSEPIKTLGAHTVTVKLDEGISTEITVQVEKEE